MEKLKKTKIKYISPIAFYRLYLTNARIKVIDIREISEYEEYHIRHSTNIPYDLLTTRPYLFINPKHTYYIICKDSKLSKSATTKLTELGYDAICVFGGLKAWRGDLAFENFYD